MALAVFPLWVFFLAEVSIWAVVEPSSWWSGLLSVLAGGVVGGAMSTIAAVSLWSAGAGDVPRIDRWCGVRFERRTTSTSAPFHTASAA